MIKVNLREAQGHLPELFEEAAHGEEVLITRDDGLTCKIVSFEAPRPKPVFGSARGQIRIHEDFDAPLEDFNRGFPDMAPFREALGAPPYPGNTILEMREDERD